MKLVLGLMLIFSVHKCVCFFSTISPQFHNLNITTESILCFVEMSLGLHELFKY